MIEDGGIMTGKADLGVKRVPSSVIPKQSKTQTRFGSGKGNDKANDAKDKKKLKKIMIAQGMLEKV